MMGWLLESASTAAFANGLADVSLKAALLLLAALVATFALRRSSASVRHQVWAAAVCAVLALPILSAGLPALEVPVIRPPAQLPAPASTPASQDVGLQGAATPAPNAAPRAAAVPGAEPNASAQPAPAVVPGALDRSAPAPRDVAAPRPFPAATGRSEAGPPADSPATGGSGMVGGSERGSWTGLVVLVYLTGALLLLGRLALGAIAAWWTVRTAEPVADRALLAEAEDVRRELGLHNTVALVVSDRISSPMAWGVLGTAILLPRSSRDWTPARRRVVLLHEIAHLKRRDCQTMLLARLAAALHWFNPLAWIATRRLQAERERACDDLVLNAGTRGPDYAQHLLDIARAVRPTSASWATVAMARPSELEGRLLAILDPGRDRRRTTRFASVVGVVAMAILLLPVAALQPWAEASPQHSDPDRIVERIRLRIQNEIDAQVRIRADVIARAAEISVEDWADALQVEPVTIETAISTAVSQVTDYDFAWEGVRAESQQDPRVMEAFNTALQDEDAGIRATAAHALGQMEDDAAVPALSRVLANDESARVREQAAWALGMIESDTGVAALTAALADAEARVREQSAWALGMIESADGVAALSAALAGDESPRVRRQAAWALGMIEDEGALDALLDAFTDEDAGVRKQALWAVGQIAG